MDRWDLPGAEMVSQAEPVEEVLGDAELTEEATDEAPAGSATATGDEGQSSGAPLTL